MSNSRKELKAYVRYDGKNNVVPGSLIFRKKKPSGKFKELVNPAADLCCSPTTTTTTTTTTAPPVSDYRLKANIIATGNMINGQFAEYKWDWNSTAVELGVNNYPTVGVIAQEVALVKPEAVVFDSNIGYYRVNYNAL